MKKLNLNKEDYSIIYSGILDLVKTFSTKMAVECIYVNVMVHNYHNVYGKPVIKLSVVTSRVDGEINELVEKVNERYNIYADISAEAITHKEFVISTYRMAELAGANILYDKYGIYHELRTKGSNIEHVTNPRVIKIEKFNVR